MAKKVGDLKAGAAGTAGTDKEPVSRIFDIKAFGVVTEGALDDNGLLTVAPTTFNHRKNKGLKKGDFDKEATFLEYQAMVCHQKAAFYTARGNEISAKAERLAKFGSDSARRAAGKLARAKEQMAKLRQQLLDSGMDEAELNDLIDKM